MSTEIVAPSPEAIEAEPLPPSPPPPPPMPLQPVAPQERVETLDILRGLALFGILAANIRAFAGPAVTYFTPWMFFPALHDRIAQAFVDTLIQGKFITIFAFLFGAGFAVQFERAQGRKFGWTYSRRLFVLLLFGLVHGLLIWFGDVLLVYAMIGFLLLFFRKRQDKTIAIWATILLFYIPFVSILVFIAAQFGAAPPNFPVPTSAELAQLRETFSSGSWMDIQQQRMTDAMKYNWGMLPGMFPHLLGIFLWGVYAWRKRFFTPSAESLPKYRRAMVIGLTAGVAGNLATTILRWMFEPPPLPTTPLALLTMCLQALSVPALSLGYICAVILICQSASKRLALHRYGAIGRTALSNYLLQSVIGTLIFYSYGLGLFGMIGPAWLLLVTVAIYTMQAIASSWWIARHQFGPMEWLWRRLTYGSAMERPRENVIAEPVPS
jgi:uncharacterized protein